MKSRDQVRREVFGWADDILAEQNLFALLGNTLPKKPVTTSDMWYDGDDILCRTEDVADAVADWLDEHGYTTLTGCYDPEGDRENDCVDEYTGWWYVTT